MTHLENVDRDGKPIKSGCRVEFDGLGLPVEHGKMQYAPHYHGWLFLADDGNIHMPIIDWQPRKRIFKYYRVV